MQSVKSCFNLTLFRKNLTRFWPIWSAYLVLWLLFPLTLLNNGWEPWWDMTPYLQIGLVSSVIFGVIAAMSVFSYLYNAKSVQLMHSLPIRRGGLFLTNYLSGLAFLLLPNLIIFLLAMAAGGYFYPGELALWLLAQCLMGLFFYSFAVFCAMFTGNLLALPIFYFILNFLVAGLYSVISYLLRALLFGFSGTTGADQLVAWFTPALRLMADVSYYASEPGVNHFTGLPALLLYTLVGILMTVAALFIYRRRKLETAGDLVSVRWVRPVFKYGVAFCSAVTVGLWLYDTFDDLRPAGEWGILIPLLLCGLVGYFAAAMLLKKSVKVFGSAWKGAVCFSLVLIAAFFATSLDLFGYNNTPARASIATVRIQGVNTSPGDSGSYLNLTLADDADINAVLALHGYISEHKNDIKADLNRIDRSNEQRWRTETLSDGTVLETRYYDSQSLSILYTLTDGSVVRREYRIPIYADNLGDPNSPEAMLTALLNRPSTVEQLYWKNSNLSPDASLSNVTLDVKRADGYQETIIYDQADRENLLAAVKADMAAGRIGTRYLLDTAQRYENCYYNDLTFYFYLPGTSEKNAADSTLPAAQRESRDWAITVTLQTTATETLKALERLGYTEGGQLITWAEQMQQDGAETKAREAQYEESYLMPVG